MRAGIADVHQRHPCVLPEAFGLETLARLAAPLRGIARAA